MPIDIRDESGITVITVTGKLKIGEQEVGVWETVLGVLDEGHRKLVLNLSDVGAIDSGGVGELVAAHTSATNRGGELKLEGLSPKLARILQITQLMGILETFDNEADALASFAG